MLIRVLGAGYSSSSTTTILRGSWSSSNFRKLRNASALAHRCGVVSVPLSFLSSRFGFRERAPASRGKRKKARPYVRNVLPFFFSLSLRIYSPALRQRLCVSGRRSLSARAARPFFAAGINIV